MKVESPRTLAGSITGSAAADSVVKIAMIFRVWAPASAEPKDHHSANALRQRPGVLALIEDAAASKRGVFLATDDLLAISGLKEPADALVLSRQIQHGMRGFRGHASAAAVALSIAIDFSGCPAPAVTKKTDEDENLPKPAWLSPEITSQTQQISHDLISLLAISKPAQVLITHDLLQQITAIKGLPLKSFPGRFGVYEYRWTGEDELERLQSEPQFTLAALPSTVPAEAATTELKDATTGTIGAGAVGTVLDELQRERGMALRLRTVLRPRPALWPGILAVAVIAAIALVGFGLFHIHSSAPTNTTPLSPVSRNAQGQTPDSPPAAAAHATSKNKAPQASSPRMKNGRQILAAPVQAGAETSSATATAPSQPCTLPGEINKYANLAESRRERGDYAGAIRLFREVLNCDPNNVQAREGLNRAIQAQEQSH